MEPLTQGVLLVIFVLYIKPKAPMGKTHKKTPFKKREPKVIKIKKKLTEEEFEDLLSPPVPLPGSGVQ